MKFFRKLEQKYGRYAISNLMYYIVILYGMGLILYLLNPMFYWLYLSLDMAAIFHGQICRQIPSALIHFIILKRMGKNTMQQYMEVNPGNHP